MQSQRYRNNGDNEEASLSAVNWNCVGYSDCNVDVTSDEQRSSSSTVDRHTRQAAPRSQSTTTTTSYGCVARHFIVTDDDLHDAEARLDAAET